MMPAETTAIGERIRSLRDKQGLSVEDIAQKSEIAASTIAAIEEHNLEPPLGTIISLAKALKVSVGELFGAKGDSPFCIVRSDNRKTISRFDSATKTSAGYSYESLGLYKEHRRMEPFLVTLNPHEADNVSPNRHDGEEIIFVLQGQVEVRLDNHTDILNPGDSIYYDSTIPHTVTCRGNEPATILAVIYVEEEIIIF